MSIVPGKYELISSDNFDEYLKAAGVGFAKRAIASTMKPTIEVSESNGEYTIKTISTLKNTEIKFKSGVEFDEETADGRKAKSVVTVEGNKLTHVQRIGNEEAVTTRVFEGGEMKVVYNCKGVTATRVYKKGQHKLLDKIRSIHGNGCIVCKILKKE